MCFIGIVSGKKMLAKIGSYSMVQREVGEVQFIDTRSDKNFSIFSRMFTVLQN
jgi:hypothetical protein